MAVKIAVIDTGVNYDMLEPGIAITDNVYEIKNKRIKNKKIHKFA